MSAKGEGLSIRFIRDYDASADRWTNRIGVSHDTVFMLAMEDNRDIPFAQKMADAYAFIKSRTH